MEKEICKYCKFNCDGYCRRYPTHVKYDFPRVSPEFWCGEFQPIKTIEPVK